MATQTPGAAFTPYTGAPMMFNGGMSDYGGSFGAPMSLTGGGSQIMPPGGGWGEPQIMPPGGAPAPYGAATGTSQSGGSYIDPLNTQSWFDMGANGQPNWHTPSSAATGAVDSFLSGGQGGPTGASQSPAMGPGLAQWANMHNAPPSQGGGSGGQMNYDGYYQQPGGGSPGGGGVSAGAASMADYKMNPYLQQMGQGLMGQFNQNLTQNTLPALRGGVVAAGGVGGSRQGIAEGLAAGQSNTGMANALTNMYGQDYEQDRNRALQQYGMDQNFNLGNASLGLQSQSQANQYDLGRRGIDLGYLNADNSYALGRGGLANQATGISNQYNLGLGGLANQRYGMDQSYNLGNQGQMQNFYDTNRGLDLQQAQLGMNFMNQGNNGQWSGINNANQNYNNYTGYGSNTTQTGTNLGQGAGNGLAMYQYGAGNGWWGGGDAPGGYGQPW